MGNVDNLDFDDDSFDVAYCRLVLMHVRDPVRTVGEVRRVTRGDGLVAGSDHDDGGVITHPPMPAAMNLLSKYVELAKARGEDRYIGRRLFSTFSQAGLHAIRVLPIPQVATKQNPDLLSLMAAIPVQMMTAVKEELIDGGYTSEEDFERGMEEFHQFPKDPGALAMGTVP